jgi:protein TonB
MRKVMFILSLLIATTASIAQKRAANQNRDVGVLYMNPQIAPSFPGGEAAWQTFIANNLDQSVPVKNGAPAGTYTVVVSFIVGMDSAVSNVRCTSDPGYGMCGEAMRLIEKSGKWTPGKQAGRFVNGYKLQPIVFRIN